MTQSKRFDPGELVLFQYSSVVAKRLSASGVEKNLKLLIGLVLLYSHLTFAANAAYQDGDIIFQQSQSNQSKAIREATASQWSHVGILFQKNTRWYVAEAVQPVRVTPLKSFIARGMNRSYRVYRLPSLTEAQKLDLSQQVAAMIGQNYDIYFEWSDKLIYCSELVYKTYLKATGVEIGTVQKFRDLRLEGPYVRELIRKRLKDTGRGLNLDELIVTPATQLQDSDLVLVEQSGS